MTRRKNSAQRDRGPRRFSGATLRRLREDAGMRREDLAAHAECGFSSLYLWETGNTTPNANALARLANTLGVAIDDLFDEEAE